MKLKFWYSEVQSGSSGYGMKACIRYIIWPVRLYI